MQFISIIEGGREVFNVDFERTSFIENVIYGHDLIDYALKTDIPTMLELKFLFTHK